MNIQNIKFKIKNKDISNFKILISLTKSNIFYPVFTLLFAFFIILFNFFSIAWQYFCFYEELFNSLNYLEACKDGSNADLSKNPPCPDRKKNLILQSVFAQTEAKLRTAENPENENEKQKKLWESDWKT